MIYMKWYALFVKSGEEDYVKLWLEKFFTQEELRPLVPKRKIPERKQGVVRDTIKTLFPGYVLINTHMTSEMYYRIKNIPVIFNVLKTEVYPVNVRDEEMDLILALTREDEVIDYSHIFFEGKKVVVARGPLKGLEGIILNYDKRKQRIKVQVEFLGQVKKIDLGATMVD